MKDVNELVVCKEDYETKQDFENAIRDAIMVLLNNGYIMTVRYDEKGLGIVAIDYNYQNQAYGAPYPRWLTAMDYEMMLASVDNETEDE